MKNQYFGDFKDFCKYGLLRFLSDYGKNSLKTGVCWMLTEPENKAQGMDVEYLRPPGICKDCDRGLYEYLEKVVPVNLKLDIKYEKILKERMRLITELIVDTNVSLIDQNPIIPNCVYNTRTENGAFDHLTAFDNGGYLKRFKEIADSEQCDLLFFDPDNGVLVKNHSGLEKYISHSEINMFRDKSLLIFQFSKFNLFDLHNPAKEKCYKPIKTNLNHLKADLSQSKLHLFKTANVMFILVVHDSGKEFFKERIEAFQSSPWHTSRTMIYENY